MATQIYQSAWVPPIPFLKMFPLEFQTLDTYQQHPSTLLEPRRPESEKSQRLCLGAIKSPTCLLKSIASAESFPLDLKATNQSLHQGSKYFGADSERHFMLQMSYISRLWRYPCPPEHHLFKYPKEEVIVPISAGKGSPLELNSAACITPPFHRQPRISAVAVLCSSRLNKASNTILICHPLLHIINLSLHFIMKIILREQNSFDWRMSCSPLQRGAANGSS